MVEMVAVSPWVLLLVAPLVLALVVFLAWKLFVFLSGMSGSGWRKFEVNGMGSGGLGAVSAGVAEALVYWALGGLLLVVLLFLVWKLVVFLSGMFG